MRRWGLCANNGEIESAIQFLEALRPNLPVIKKQEYAANPAPHPVG
jgi:hypothetical protein